MLLVIFNSSYFGVHKSHKLELSTKDNSFVFNYALLSFWLGPMLWSGLGASQLSLPTLNICLEKIFLTISQWSKCTVDLNHDFGFSTCFRGNAKNNYENNGSKRSHPLSLKITPPGLFMSPLY